MVINYSAEELKYISEELNDIADVLIEYGWVKQDFGTKKYGFCTLGAEQFVIEQYNINDCFGYHTGKPCREYLTSYIRTNGYNSIMQWNDIPHRTKHSVICTLRMLARRALKEAEALEQTT